MINGVRNFKLINANGAEYDMTRSFSLLTEPRGLGWGLEADVERMGMTFVATRTDEIRQTPTGSMVFRDYAEYATFLAFCQVGGLVFCYRPQATWYYLKCIISIEKTEIDYYNDHLTCPITITALSYWYSKTIARTAEGDDPLRQTKTYDYEYDYVYSEGTKNLFDFHLNLPSYFKLTIFGEATDPEWRVLQNGSITHSGALNSLTVGSTEKLIINTNPKEMEIATYSLQDVRIASQYAYSDWSTERIFAIPAGDIQFQVLTDDVNPPLVMLEVLEHV